MLVWLIMISAGFDMLCLGVLGDADLSCWTVTPGYHYTDQGLEQAPFDDIESCINHCFGLPECSIIDLDFNSSPKCWVQTQSFTPTKTALKPAASVTNYMLDRACEDLRCWVATPEQHYTDPGLEQTSFNDLASCIHHCNTLPQCGVIDMNTESSPKCWAQTTEFSPSQNALQPLASAINYMLDKDCQSLTSGIDLNCWSVTAGYHYTDQGLEQVSTNDLRECLKKCIDTPDCGVVDFDRSSSPTCWIQQKAFDVTKSALKPMASNINFILNKDCNFLV